MVAPIGLQPYTVREAIKEDYQGVMRRIADIGYLGIEASLESLSEQLPFYRSLGLQVTSVMTVHPPDTQQRSLLDQVKSAGTEYLSVGWIAPDRFQTLDGVKQAAEQLNTANALVRQHDLSLLYHNHWWENEPIFAGRTPHEVLREYLDPTILFEIDVYWVATGGSDPLQLVRELGARAPLLHIKDGPAILKQPMTALGEGTLDLPAIIHSTSDTAKWLIVELDECATDMLEAVEKSYRYLVDNQLGYGSKS